MVVAGKAVVVMAAETAAAVMVVVATVVVEIPHRDDRRGLGAARSFGLRRRVLE